MDREYYITWESSNHGDGPIRPPAPHGDWRVVSTSQGSGIYNGHSTVAIVWEKDETR